MHNRWALEHWTWLDDLRIEQVETLHGNFWTSGGRNANATLSDATWFVPYAKTLPVMVRKKNRLWGPRGF